MALFLLPVLMMCSPAEARRKAVRPHDSLPAVPGLIAAKPNMSGPMCNAVEGDCGIEVAPKDELGRFEVKPGGDTACLDGSPYSFQVRQGDPRKLHIHFQGGGVCDSWAPYIIGACSRRVEHEWQGLFNYTDAANPLQNYSVLVVNYCSGDSHAGNSDERWAWMQVKIRGYNNAMSAVSYALSNFRDLDSLAFSGTSAGSLGLHVWARGAIKKFRGIAKDMTVMLDGWLDLPAHPSKTKNPITHVCNLDILEPEDKEACVDNKFFLYSQFERAIVANPDVRFAVINGAVDSVQVGVYGVGDEEFYKQQTLLLKNELRHPNLYVYLVQTDQHVFFIRPTLDVTTPDSVDGSGSARPLLTKWVTELLSSPPQPRVVCAGEKRDVTMETNVTGWGYKYCGLQ